MAPRATVASALVVAGVIGLATADAPVRLSLQRRTVPPEEWANDADSEAAPRHPAGRRMIRQRLRRAQDAVSVFGPMRTLAYFYAEAFIGSRSQRFSVITDTGSNLMAVPCITCGSSCGRHQNPPFDPAASTTAAGMPCGECGGASCTPQGLCSYHQGYAEGSMIEGAMYRDRVYLGDERVNGSGPSSPHAAYALDGFAFGCQTAEGGLFKTQLADGIMGMGQGSRSFVHELVVAGKLPRPMFSLCLHMDGGVMTLGGIDGSLHGGCVRWARMWDTGYYGVDIAAFTLEGRALPTQYFNAPQRTIVDSGTTFSYIPPASFSALVAAIDDICGQTGRCRGERVTFDGEGPCFRLSNAADISTFPSASFVLTGADGGPDVTITIPPQHLFVAMSWHNGEVCLSIYNSMTTSGNQVFGASAMLGYDVIFDTPHAPYDHPNEPNPTGTWRVGFAPSSCTTSVASSDWATPVNCTPSTAPRESPAPRCLVRPHASPPPLLPPPPSQCRCHPRLSPLPRRRPHPHLPRP